MNDMPKDVQHLPLYPDDSLFYEAWGYTNDHRFVEVFQHTWTRIPEQYRRELLKYWSAKAVDFHERQPRIVVWRTHLHWDEGGDPYPVAQSERLGTEIYFRSNWIDIMPDDVLGILIAHELGHCYLAAANGADYWNEENGFLQEADVAELLMWWDFSQERLDEWTEANRHDFACNGCGEEIVAPIGSRECCRICGNKYIITKDKRTVLMKSD